jgi:hypothetical protein
MNSRAVLYGLLLAPFGFLFYCWGFAAWIFLSDMASFAIKRQPPKPPKDWSHLLTGELPQATPEEVDYQKEHLKRSCHRQGYHAQRNSHYGLINNPLELEEFSPAYLGALSHDLSKRSR